MANYDVRISFIFAKTIHRECSSSHMASGQGKWYSIMLNSLIALVDSVSSTYEESLSKCSIT